MGRKWQGNLLIARQNVDDLHERAALDMHAALASAHYAACRARWQRTAVTAPDDRCPGCCAGPVRPDIVRFDESYYHLQEIWTALRAEFLIVPTGASETVFPVAAITQNAAPFGVACFERNAEASAVASDFHGIRLDPASRIVPAWVNEKLAAAPNGSV